MCASGCQMVSMGFNGEMASKDPLYVGPNNVKKHFKITKKESLGKETFVNNLFYPNRNLRFRDEKEFYLINIQWGNTITVPYEIGKFLEKTHKTKQTFSSNEFINKDISWMKKLFEKGVILSDKIKTDPEAFNQGVSANLEDMPAF